MIWKSSSRCAGSLWWTENHFPWDGFRRTALIFELKICSFVLRLSRFECQLGLNWSNAACAFLMQCLMSALTSSVIWLHWFMPINSQFSYYLLVDGIWHLLKLFLLKWTCHPRTVASLSSLKIQWNSFMVDMGIEYTNFNILLLQ